MLFLRSLAFNLGFYALTTLVALGCLPALVARRPVLGVARLWARGTIWLLRVAAGIRVEFRGLENIPKGPLLVAAKHQSALETLALCAIFPEFAYVLKRELLFIPVVGWYLSRGGMVAIDRSKGNRAMALMNAAAAEAIAHGRQLIVFPEGTRRPTNAPPVYKQGLSHLYAALRVPCLPVALNTGLFWPRRGFLRLPGTAVIEVLPPIQPGMERAAFHATVLERIETASNALLDAGRAELAANGHSVPGPQAETAARSPAAR
ncbi:lysophospholipid acyltransferase family protein [Methylobacterium symbioticum]|uniref:1-acyl-sn-glycerol-3-phosphate acyltransferase n=1 Tax=Methylobacterium symbioticum TaxID=2584084 RepID=A0A509EBK7_9HYPH|nr:lysophospholipid acyltransferase family protein [Methylobacterium symbioticum]VUD71540.1 1-acyl-sn-glycerol-3-phosphate acyltransferase [Methylobacterium symbioticum]